MEPLELLDNHSQSYCLHQTPNQHNKRTALESCRNKSDEFCASRNFESRDFETSQLDFDIKRRRSVSIVPGSYMETALVLQTTPILFNQYIHTEQEEIHAIYHACSFDFHQDCANNRDRAYNVSKGAHSVLVLETVLVMETCA